MPGKASVSPAYWRGARATDNAAQSLRVPYVTRSSAERSAGCGPAGPANATKLGHGT